MVTTALLSVATLWFLAVIIPGPNMLVAARAAATGGRGAGLWCALGIACGTALWGLAGAFGIGVLFAAVPWLYLALKVGGGLYICWLGIKLVRGARTGTDSPPAPVSQAFRAGLLTTLSNPKTAAFVASIFALSFPRDAGALLGFVAAGLMAAISIGWYGTMAFVLGSPRAGRAYARTRAWIDRLSGGLFIALGLRLALTRATPG